MQLDIILSSLGWALLHSVWQGFFAAMVVYAFRGTFKSASANARYSFQFLCLSLCFVAFITTFGLYAFAGSSGAPTQSIGTSFTEIIQFGRATIAPTTDVAAPINYSALLHQSAPLLGAFWILGFIVISLRCAVSYQMTQSLRKKGLSEAPNAWEMRFKALARQAGLKRMANIYISSRVSGPITLGFFKPVVLVPASFFTQLPKDQIEAVLLHELAHIRRHDYLLNILQTAIKAVLFYHPGIHYICRKINDDREYACDDFSVNETQNPKALARALAALRLSHPENSFAMAAKGTEGPLLARLQRLVKTTPMKAKRERGQGTVPAIALLLSTAVYFAIAPVSEAHPDPEQEPKKHYEHAKAKKHNYKFKTTRIDGKPVTIKVTEDGRQWVLVDGAWYDVDKKEHREFLENESGILAYPPVPPVAPVPPVPPVIAGLENAGSKKSEKAMRKFEKEMDQFEIDMQYFEKSMENWGREFGESFASEYEGLEGEAIADAIASAMANGNAAAYAEMGEDLESRDHPESEKRAEDRAAEMRERMLERAEAQREKSMERAEAQRERAEEMRERAEERREAALERAEEQRERAMERAEEQRERAEEQRERAEEQRESAMERAEAARERADEQREKHLEFRNELTNLLMHDGMISKRSQSVELRYTDGHWTANGKRVPSNTEDNYCDLIADFGIQKSSHTKIKMKPGSLEIQSKTENGSNNRTTYGTFKHGDDHASHKGMHKNKHGEWHADHGDKKDKDEKKEGWKEGSNTIGFIQPVSTANVTARYGQDNPVIWKQSHQGIDLAAQQGTAIHASADGKVIRVENHKTYGNVVEIDHGYGFQTRYAHMKGTCVTPDQTISAGEKIGTVGMTGNTTGPHLHFEVRKDGDAVNPEDLIAGF